MPFSIHEWARKLDGTLVNAMHVEVILRAKILSPIKQQNKVERINENTKSTEILPVYMPGSYAPL